MPNPQDYVHMLNATMCAITRVICVILELNQTEEGMWETQPFVLSALLFAFVVFAASYPPLPSSVLCLL